MASSLLHASRTASAITLDVKTLDMIPWIAYQEAVKDLHSENSVVFHDLSTKPR